jgi:hypothetical protein
LCAADRPHEDINVVMAIDTPWHFHRHSSN